MRPGSVCLVVLASACCSNPWGSLKARHAYAVEGAPQVPDPETCVNDAHAGEEVPISGSLAMLQKQVISAPAAAAAADLPASPLEAAVDVDDDETEDEKAAGGHISLMSIAAHESSEARTQPAKSEETSSKRRLGEALMQDLGSGVGSKADLSEKGYKSVAALNNNKEMEAFIRRVITKLGLHVVDEGALKGVVPYYSGKKAKQNFAQLKDEIEGVRKKKKMKKRWLKTKAEFKKEKEDEKEEEKEDEDEDDDKKEEEEEEEEEDEEEKDVSKKKTKGKKKADGKPPKKQLGELLRRVKKAGAFVQTDESPSRSTELSGSRSELLKAKYDRPTPRRGKWAENDPSLVQTDSMAASSSSIAWMTWMFSALEGQAIYWLGARVTAVTAVLSLVFGLFLFDESSRQAREESSLEESEESLLRAAPESQGEQHWKVPSEATLNDLRPTAPSNASPVATSRQSAQSDGGCTEEAGFADSEYMSEGIPESSSNC